MQNRFTVKDFFLFLILGIVGLMIGLSMCQSQQLQQQVLDTNSKVDGVEAGLANLQRQVDADGRDLDSVSRKIDNLSDSLTAVEQKLESGIVVQGGQTANDTPRGTMPDLAEVESDRRDTSWARPGVPIQWQEPYDFESDPRAYENFAEGGSFTELFPAQPAKLTPILAEDAYGRRVGDFVVESMFTYDPETLEMKGVLAEAWQIDPEGMWVRVKIREDARFSDGAPVTAEDVIWSYEQYLMNPELETESARSIYRGKFDQLSIIDEKAFEVTFPEKGAYNVRFALGISVLPKHFYSQFTPSELNRSTGLLMGSGPYKLRILDPDNQWAPPQDVVLVRNELYWGPRPPLDEMRFRVVNDEQRRLIAYRNGEADMTIPTPPQFVEITRQPGWNEDHYSLKWLNMRSGYSFIGWQCGERNGRLTPFHDKRVRQAMTMLIDRQRMIDEIFEGIGEVAIGPNNPPKPSAPDIEPWPYDPERAIELLAEAGWEDRDGNGVLENDRGDEFSFEFTISGGGALSERIQNFIVDACRRAGIRCVINAVDWAQYDTILKTRDFDAITLSWGSSAPESDLTQIWHSDSIKNQGHNFIQWTHPDQDPLLEAIRSEVDYDKRMELFHEFGRLLHEEQPYTFMRVGPWLRFINRDFQNVHPYNSGLEVWEFFEVGQGARTAPGF